MRREPRLYSATGIDALGRRVAWHGLADHRGAAFAWLMLAYPSVEPASVKVTLYGT